MAAELLYLTYAQLLKYLPGAKPNCGEQSKFPVVEHWLEGDGPNVRCRVALDASGHGTFIDIPLEEFNKLKRQEIPHDLLE